MVEIRSVAEDELPTAVRTLSTAFGGRAVEALVEPTAATAEPERFFVATDADAIVGTGGTLSLRLTVPGGVTVPFGGLTWIGVLPTHRRRGILRRMMERHLRDVRDRGEPLGGLLASEAGIYGRFGYGISTLMTRYDIDSREATFVGPVGDAGSIDLVDQDTMLEVITDLHERIREGIVGEVSRSEAGWRAFFAELEEEVSGWQGNHYVLHRDADGEPDGYAVYRIGEDAWPDSLPRMRLDVFKVAGTSDAVRHALLRYLLDLDLIATVRVLNAPTDDPLRWLLRDPRQLRTTRVWDGLWLRMVDVAGALRARRYEVAGHLTLDVHDDIFGAGRFSLDGSPADATCVPTDADPDVVLDVATLGSLYLGGTGAASLASAGRIEERTPGAIAIADRMFRTARAPFCSTGF